MYGDTRIGFEIYAKNVGDSIKANRAVQLWTNSKVDLIFSTRNIKCIFQPHSDVILAKIKNWKDLDEFGCNMYKAHASCWLTQTTNNYDFNCD